MTVEIFKPGNNESIDSASFLKQLDSGSKNIDAPFCDQRIDALNEIATTLLHSPMAAQAPQILALGFWLRKSAVKQIQRDLLPQLPGCYSVPRGLAFHLPPANVDTLFAYSWALSFLAGNSNVVRLPSEMNPVADYLVSSILECLCKRDMAESQQFVFFDKTSDLVESISSIADLRVIWGGDAKVLAVSRYPVRPDGLSIGFSDRKSLSIISADAYANADETTRRDVAQKFYNDLYWFDQLGCGSPRALIWVGDKGQHSNDFYSMLQSVVVGKAERIETGIAISKFVFSNEMAGIGISNEVQRYSNELTVLNAEVQTGLLENTHGGGILFDCQCKSVEEIACLIQRNVQTITHFGLSDAEMASLKSVVNGAGGYRIVPIGEALSFSPIWDGMNLIGMFTRLVAVDSGR